MQLLSDLQDQVVDRLQTDLGDHGLFVERAETEDEFVLGEWISDNLSQIAQYPHALVWMGTLIYQGADSTKRLAIVDAPVRVFLMVRDASHENEQAQKRLGDYWSLLIASSLQGTRFGHQDATQDAITDGLAVDILGNTEDAAMFEISFNLELKIDLDYVLNNI